MGCHRSSKTEGGSVSHPSKTKGNGFEREIVNAAKAKGLNAERAYASNGRALGQSEEVDCIVEGCRIQAKRRKALPAYLQIPDGCDAVVFRQDRGPSLALITLPALLDKLEGGW